MSRCAGVVMQHGYYMYYQAGGWGRRWADVAHSVVPFKLMKELPCILDEF